MSHEEIRRGLRALALGGLPAWDGIDDEAVKQLRETCSLVLRERAKERRRLAKEAQGTESERRQRAAAAAMGRMGSLKTIPSVLETCVVCDEQYCDTYRDDQPDEPIHDECQEREHPEQA